MKNMKMYILVPDYVPDYFVPTACAHASLMVHLKFQSDHVYQDWLSYSFKKVICRVDPKCFETAKHHPDHVIVTENNPRVTGEMPNNEVALAFCPRMEMPKPFQYFKLWKPKE